MFWIMNKNDFAITNKELLKMGPKVITYTVRCSLDINTIWYITPQYISIIIPIINKSLLFQHY